MVVIVLRISKTFHKALPSMRANNFHKVEKCKNYFSHFIIKDILWGGEGIRPAFFLQMFISLSVKCGR
jgi:hypothetical protein